MRLTNEELVDDYILTSEELLRADVFITQIGDIKLDFSSVPYVPPHAFRGKFVKSTRYSGKIGDEYDLCVFQDHNGFLPDEYYNDMWIDNYYRIKDAFTSIIVVMRRWRNINYDAVKKLSHQSAVMLEAMINPAKLMNTFVHNYREKHRDVGDIYGVMRLPSDNNETCKEYYFYVKGHSIDWQDTSCANLLLDVWKLHYALTNNKVCCPNDKQMCTGVKIVNMSYMHYWLANDHSGSIYNMTQQYFGYVNIEKNCANCIHEDNETKKKEVLANTYLQVKDIKVAPDEKNGKNWVDMDIIFYSYNENYRKSYFNHNFLIHNYLVMRCVFKDKNGKICKQTYEDTTRIAKMCFALYSVLTFHVASAEMVGFEYQLKDQSCKDTFNVLSPEFLIKSNDIKHEREATRLLGHPLPKLDDVKEEEEKESGSSYPRYDLAIVFENFFANVDVRKSCMLFYRALTLQETHKEQSFMNLYQCLLDYIDENFSKIDGYCKEGGKNKTDGERIEFGLKVLLKCQPSKTLSNQKKDIQKELCKECCEGMFYKTWDTREKDLDEFINNIDDKINTIAKDMAKIRNAIAHGGLVPVSDDDFRRYYACLCKITYYAVLQDLGILHETAMKFLPIVGW
ncbi:MAG: hypothetical protein IJT15_00440 [Rickettsiales bacterium]|nr:hypothetical protein [Rickettsiales bacterium]